MFLLLRNIVLVLFAMFVKARYLAKLVKVFGANDIYYQSFFVIHASYHLSKEKSYRKFVSMP